jgi:hypothetical protein
VFGSQANPKYDAMHILVEFFADVSATLSIDEPVLDILARWCCKAVRHSLAVDDYGKCAHC